MRKLISSSLFMVLGLSAMMYLSTGCEKNTQADNDVAPELPPVSTLEIDFSDFNEATKSGTPDSLLADSTQKNKGTAVLNVFGWNFVLGVHMIVPVTAFKAALNHQPEQQEDGRWLWTYDCKVGAHTYTAKLYAQEIEDEVNWDMYLSQQGGFTDFNWYSGIAKKDLTEGSWKLYKSPEAAVEFVDIVWHRNVADNTTDIKYTNVEVGSAGQGGYITYGKVNDEVYNSFYEIFHIEKDNLINIQWHRTIKDGRIRNEVAFKDTVYHCWNTDGYDVICQ